MVHGGEPIIFSRLARDAFLAAGDHLPNCVPPSDFDVAIAGSVPLIDDFDDVDPTLAPINTLGRRSEIRMRLECILQCLARLDSKEFTPLHGLFLRPRTYPTTSLNKGRVVHQERDCQRSPSTEICQV